MWGSLGSGFLLVTTVKMVASADLAGKWEGKSVCRVLTSSAHTNTSWDYSFGLTVNPGVCEFVCFGQIITSCFLEDTASFPSTGSSRSYQAVGMCGVNKTERAGGPPTEQPQQAAPSLEKPGVAISPTSQVLKESQVQV